MLRMRGEIQRLIFASGDDGRPGRLADVAFNLPMLLAFDVLKKTVEFAIKEQKLGTKKGWVQDARVLPKWIKFANFTAINDRRDEIVHDGVLHPRLQCSSDIAFIEAQLVSWRVIHEPD